MATAAKPAPMLKNEVYALELGAVYRPTAAALRSKYIVAWCYGRGGTMGSGAPMFRFGVGDALFDSKPTLAEVRKRKPVLHTLTHQNPRGLAAVYDNPLDPERGVSLLGVLPSLAPLTAKQIREREWGGWYHMAQDYNFNWRELHDTAALERARAASKAKGAKAAAAATTKRRAGGLAGIARRTLAPELTGMIAKARATGTRTILKSAITALKRRASATPADKQAILKAAVERLNAYDAKLGGFIETAEREALLTCLSDIAWAAGLGELSAELDDWRDW